MSERLRTLREAWERAAPRDRGTITGTELLLTLGSPIRVAKIRWLRPQAVVEIVAAASVRPNDATRARLGDEVLAINAATDGVPLQLAAGGIYARVVLYMDPDFSISARAYDRALALVFEATTTHTERLHRAGSLSES